MDGRVIGAGGACFVVSVGLALVAGCRDDSKPAFWGGSAPLVIDVDGDGVDDVIGAASATELAAYDGKSWRRSWTAKAPKGLLEATATHVVVLSGKELRTYARRTGAFGATVTLPHEVSVLCASASFGERIFVRFPDHTTARIDPVSGAIDMGAVVPDACPSERNKPRACEAALGACDVDGKTPSGRLAPNLTLRSGGRVVDVITKRGDHPSVDVIGYLAGSVGDARYTTTIDPSGASVDAADIAGGLLFVKQGASVTAIDTETGAVRWKAALGNSPSSVFRATLTRVYVGCSGKDETKALRVADAETGKIVGTFGTLP